MGQGGWEGGKREEGREASERRGRGVGEKREGERFHFWHCLMSEGGWKEVREMGGRGEKRETDREEGRRVMGVLLN